MQYVVLEVLTTHSVVVYTVTETIGYCILHLTNENETLVYNAAERPTIKLQKADLLSASQIQEFWYILLLCSMCTWMQIEQ